MAIAQLFSGWLVPFYPERATSRGINPDAHICVSLAILPTLFIPMNITFFLIWSHNNKLIVIEFTIIRLCNYYCCRQGVQTNYDVQASKLHANNNSHFFSRSFHAVSFNTEFDSKRLQCRMNKLLRRHQSRDM